MFKVPYVYYSLYVSYIQSLCFIWQKCTDIIYSRVCTIIWYSVWVDAWEFGTSVSRSCLSSSLRRDGRDGCAGASLPPLNLNLLQVLHIWGSCYLWLIFAFGSVGFECPRSSESHLSPSLFQSLFASWKLFANLHKLRHNVSQND